MLFGHDGTLRYFVVSFVERFLGQVRGLTGSLVRSSALSIAIQFSPYKIFIASAWNYFETSAIAMLLYGEFGAQTKPPQEASCIERLKRKRCRMMDSWTFVGNAPRFTCSDIRLPVVREDTWLVMSLFLLLVMFASKRYRDSLGLGCVFCGLGYICKVENLGGIINGVVTYCTLAAIRTTL